ncbi:MAG TPA: response regulator [Fulvivirga sp.]|nr:response regulator [Fulvivirga sp.]
MSIEDRRKVMLIDDNEIDLFINQKVLEFNNFASEVTSVMAAQIAIDKLRSLTSESVPDVIFLDLNMPVVDGFKFLYEFSLLDDCVKSRIKIVVLTSSDNFKDKEKVAANPDVLTYISKPLTDDKLAEVQLLL